jgi:hypothetical protein
LAIALSGVAVLLLCSLPPPSRMLSLPDRYDIKEYYVYAHDTFNGQVPYRDFSLEYPPGFLPVALAAGPADHGYYNRFRILMLALGCAAVCLLAAALFLVGADALELSTGVLVLATLPLTLPRELVFDRFDLWPAVLVLLAVVAVLRNQRTLGLAALGLGAAAKLYPLVLVPVVILMRRGRAHIGRDLAVVAAAALAFVLPFALIAPRGLAHVAKVLVRRPLHIESLGGSILLTAHRLGIYKPTIYLSFAHSWDLAGPVAKGVAILGSLLEAGALVAVWVLFARGPRGPREFLLAVAAAVVGFVAFGKVFSPQYLVWIAASVPLVLGRVRWFALTATVAALLLTHLISDHYTNLLHGGQMSWALLARNVVLIALFSSLVLELAGQRRARESATAVPSRPRIEGGSAPATL